MQLKKREAIIRSCNGNVIRGWRQCRQGMKCFPSRTSLFVEMRAIKSCGESRNAHILGMSCQCTLQPCPEPSVLHVVVGGGENQQERKQINTFMTIIVFLEDFIYFTSLTFTYLSLLLDVRFVCTNFIIIHYLWWFT